MFITKTGSAVSNVIANDRSLTVRTLLLTFFKMDVGIITAKIYIN